MWMNFPALYANMLCFVNALVTGHKTCTVMSITEYVYVWPVLYVEFRSRRMQFKQ